MRVLLWVQITMSRRCGTSIERRAAFREAFEMAGVQVPTPNVAVTA